MNKPVQGPNARPARPSAPAQRARPKKANDVGTPPELHDTDHEHAEEQHETGRQSSKGHASQQRHHAHHAQTHGHHNVQKKPQKTTQKKPNLLGDLDEIDNEPVHRADTLAVGDIAVTRPEGGGDQGQQRGNDGFEQGQSGRDAYAAHLRGNVREDAERMEALRKGGTRDDFRPDATPEEVEQLGAPRAAGHVVRLIEQWIDTGIDRDGLLQSSVQMMRNFVRTDGAAKLIAELEIKPIRDVYPLEMMLEMLEKHPEKVPGVRRGSVIGNADQLGGANRQFAGHPFTVSVPDQMRVKSFALLGGAPTRTGDAELTAEHEEEWALLARRPGYEFHPHPTDLGKFHMIVDTPGQWRFGLLAVETEPLKGKALRESHEKTIEIFDVRVDRMGKKGATSSFEGTPETTATGAGPQTSASSSSSPASAEVVAPKAEAAPQPTWSAGSMATAARNGRPTAPAAGVAPAESGPSLHLAQQVKAGLGNITRDDGGGLKPSYAWSFKLEHPGMPAGQAVLAEIDIKGADGLGPQWTKARDKLNEAIKKLEPRGKLVTEDDFKLAIRRARVKPRDE